MTPDELDPLLRDDAPAPPLDGVLAALHGEMAGGAREELRALPTGVRRALAVGLVLGVGGLAVLTGVRQDLHGAALDRAMGTALATIALGCVLAAASLRSLAAPAPRWTALAWLGLALPVGLALLPGWWGAPSGADGWTGCLSAGLAVAGLAAGGTLLLERSDRVPLWRLVAASGGAGMLAFGVLGAHCPSGDPTHLLLGHAVEGALVGAVAWGIDRGLAKARRR